MFCCPFSSCAETPGEDPYLTSQVSGIFTPPDPARYLTVAWGNQYAIEFVSGFQKNDLDPGHIQASACCKHYVANELEKWNNTDRNHFDAKVSIQDLLDSYLVPFQACVEGGGVSGLMVSGFLQH